jgi:hypothetical protein
MEYSGVFKLYGKSWKEKLMMTIPAAHGQGETHADEEHARQGDRNGDTAPYMSFSPEPACILSKNGAS